MFKKIAVITLMVIALAFSGNAFAQVANSGSNSGAEANAIGGGAQAAQQQGQGQTQGVALDQFNNSFNSEGLRGFAIPADNQYGPVMNFYGKQAPSVQYQDVRTILMYSCMFSEGALEKMASGAFEANLAEFKLINADDIVAPAKAAADGTRWIKIVVSQTALDKVALKGHVSGESRDRSLTMVELMADVALKALKNGANVLHITAFGATHDVFSSGWGIGFNTTMAAIDDLNKGQNRSVVGGGGLGYSSSKAGSRDQGWIQAFALVDAALVYPETPKKPVVAKVTTSDGINTEQTGNHRPVKK